MKERTFAILLICIFTLFINVQLVNSEEIANSYTGISNAHELLNNINFKDVSDKPNDYWAKDAIYEMASLSIIEGYGQDKFKPSNNITKAEAIALIYKALGKKEEAQKEAKRLEEQRFGQYKNNNVKSIWYEGYLSLARNDDLISEEEFEQAINPESYKFYLDNIFDANDDVQRQDVAVWIAKAFDIEPVYNQVLVFNNYNDWEKIDYEKVPYVEALLKQKIMNGDNGYFYPQKNIQRDEMAQVLSNVKNKMYKANNLEKKSGFIESISVQSSKYPDKITTTKTILVRVNDGTLNRITLKTERDNLASRKKEIGDHTSVAYESEVVVNKNGTLGKSNLLSKNDKIFFVFNSDKKVKYIQAKTDLETETVETIYGEVNSVDTKNNKISFADEDNINHNFIVNKGAAISINGKGEKLEDVPIGEQVCLTVKHNMVNRIEISDDKKNIPSEDTDKNNTRGIVQDINSNLNYISIYEGEGKKSSEYIKTYNFLPDVKINKNGHSGNIKEIEIGDTVYIELNDEGKAELINVETNYYSRYGKVLFIGKDFFTVKYDDGTIHQLKFDDDMTVYKNDSKVSKEEIISGDRLKLTLNQGVNGIRVKKVNIEGNYHHIKDIYKGKVYDIDKDNIILYDIMSLDKNDWNYKINKGFKNFELDDNAKIYINNELVNINEIDSTFFNKYIYLVTYKDYENNEKVKKISCVDGYEKLYNDKVILNSKASNSIQLSKSFDSINYSKGTIVSRYGRLTLGSNIKRNDPIYAVGLRDAISKNIMASIIRVKDKPSISGINIYRGKISSINEGKNFTVESFSKLIENKWSFVNTSKTFDMNNDTVIFDSSGVVNNRDFKDYSDINYENEIIYIAAKENTAKMITDAPYGVVNLRGEIYNISSENNSATLKLKDSTILDVDTNNWSYIGESEVNVLTNSIIVKNKKLVDAKNLETGDKIRVIKEEDSATGDGFIILVEG